MSSVPPYTGDPYRPGEVQFPTGYAPPPDDVPPPAAGPGAPGRRKKKRSAAVVTLIVCAIVLGLCCVGGGLVNLALPMVRESIAARQDVQSTPVPPTNVPAVGMNPPPSTNAPTGDKSTADAFTDTSEPALTAKIGQPVRGTTFEFTVTKLKCRVSKVGDNFINATAQGQFCLVTLKVKNVSEESEQYSTYNQTAKGPGGVEYKDDDQAEFWANRKNNVPFMKDINPGNSVTGTLVFDIPKDGKLVSLDLFDGAADSISITLG